MPKVSVIIPCYNQGAWIEEAIRSVQAQSYPDYEIIVVNDGSTDNATLSVLNKLEQDDIKVYHTENKGVAAARNYGVAKCNGAFILPLDADDWIDKDFLLKTVPKLEQDGRLELVGTAAQYFGEINGIEILPDYSPDLQMQRNLFFNSSLFRKKSFCAISGFDETFLDGWEDWDFFIRLVADPAQIQVVKEPLLNYRIKSTSLNADLLDEKKRRAEQQLYRKHLGRYLTFFPEPIQILRDNSFLTEQAKQYDYYRKQLNNSASYRLGHFLLSPLKWMRKKKT